MGKESSNRFSDRLKPKNRMEVYTQDPTVAEEIVKTEVPEIEPAPTSKAVESKEKVMDSRIMAYASTKPKKIANSVTLSTDVVGAVLDIVKQLEAQGLETNKSLVIDELLREKLTDLGLL